MLGSMSYGIISICMAMRALYVYLRRLIIRSRLAQSIGSTNLCAAQVKGT